MNARRWATMTAAVMAAAVVASTAPAWGGGQQPVFPAKALMPGDSFSGDLLVPAAPVAATPVLKVHDVREACRTASCDRHATLASVLQLTITAPDGDTYSGTIRQLESWVALPGGDLAAGQSRDYRATLAAPLSLGNAYEDRRISATLLWVSVDRRGRPTGPVSSTSIGSQVLGEHIDRGERRSGADLPLTGFDVAMSLSAATLLIGAGLGFVVMARVRRRRP